jgi:hypothetical protein
MRRRHLQESSLLARSMGIHQWLHLYFSEEADHYTVDEGQLAIR